jgi:CRISPR type III-A-associated RAMP protein Csm4
MNPGLVVKLRPAGPWRIGPDSGARNRVDIVYHSDSLYSAVTGAMLRLGALEEWLDATARSGNPAVCFGSCFPFVDEIGFVMPPRTVWPPQSPSASAARVRWKSARFVPIGVVQAILSGQPLDDGRWTVDGASECLLPAGRSGPFRTGVRGNAAVDRMTGAVERHSTACLEFRPGAGLWTVVSFRDEAAREAWGDRVKAAFRLLADSGFGGERSRGWGRAEAPEFVEGSLPEMILPAVKVAALEPAESSEIQEPLAAPDHAEPAEPDEPATLPTEPVEESGDGEEAADDAVSNESTEPHDPTIEGEPNPQESSSSGLTAYWLLSLFSPAQADDVDWQRGNYSLIARCGRVESPAGSGELKKTVNMVTEGSVIYTPGAPRGSAPDVAPDGFAHPVFRAGFALAIPLPEGR